MVDSPDGPQVRLETTLVVLPERLGVAEGGDPVKGTLDLLEAGVQRGMRAQLSRAGLLNPTLFVDLVELPDQPPAELDRTATPHPLLPTVPPESGGLMSSADGLMERAAKLPIEDVMQSVLSVLANINTLIASEDVQAVPRDVALVISDLRTLIASEGVQTAPAEMAAILQAVRGVIDEVAAEQVAANLAGALEEARTTLRSVGAAAEDMPGVVTGIEGLTGEVRALPLEEMVAAATQLIASVDAVVKSQEVTGLPAEAQGAIADLRLILRDLHEGGATANLNATLASARRVSDEIAAAEIAARIDSVVAAVTTTAGNVDTATAGLPELVTSLTELSDKAATLPLSETVATANRLLTSVETLVASEAVSGLPAELDGAVADLRQILQSLEAGGATENLTATLASARRITDELAAAELTRRLDELIAEVRLATTNVNAATADLPHLLDSLTALSDKASALPLDQFVASGTRALDNAATVLRNDVADGMPNRLSAALLEFEQLLRELREGGAVANFNRTLASADQAAAAITTAAAELPALVDQISAAAARADAALISVGPGSELNRDTTLLLNEVRAAARSVESLATALERRPNSVLFGR